MSLACSKNGTTSAGSSALTSATYSWVSVNRKGGSAAQILALAQVSVSISERMECVFKSNFSCAVPADGCNLRNPELRNLGIQNHGTMELRNSELRNYGTVS